MNAGYHHRPQISLIHDPEIDKALFASPTQREDQKNEPFFYANCCLGLFPADPVDFRAFARGQLIVIAILIPAALLFLHAFSLAIPPTRHAATARQSELRIEFGAQ
jgi:hypothetical protein